MGVLADRIADMIASYVDGAIRKIPVMTAVGTVVTSPQQKTTDPLTVVVDGSALSVPVKQVRGLPLVQGARVVLVRFGSDWAVVGSLSNPAIGTNTSRIVIGADMPEELQAYGIETGILSYITDKTTGIEVGYFFIGCTNSIDAFANVRALVFGNVTYPIPGLPDTATSLDVRTNFQQDMFNQVPSTVFKDHNVEFWTGGVFGAQINATGGLQGVEPGTSTVETWHDFPFSNAWAAPAAGIMRLKYRLTAMREVQLIGSAVSPNPFHNTVGTLAAGYRPLNSQGIFARGASATDPMMRITSAGVCEAFGSSTIGVTWFFNGTFSIDN